MSSDTDKGKQANREGILLIPVGIFAFIHVYTLDSYKIFKILVELVHTLYFRGHLFSVSHTEFSRMALEGDLCLSMI